MQLLEEMEVKAVMDGQILEGVVDGGREEMLILAVNEEPNGRPWRQVRNEWNTSHFCMAAKIRHSSWTQRAMDFKVEIAL